MSLPVSQRILNQKLQFLTKKVLAFNFWNNELHSGLIRSTMLKYDTAEYSY